MLNAALRSAPPIHDEALFREQALIDDRWVSSDSGMTLPVRDPATGTIIGTVPNMGAGETRRAIEAAARALPAWSAQTAKERGLLLRRWYDLVIRSQEDLAVLMTAEQGQTPGGVEGPNRLLSVLY